MAEEKIKFRLKGHESFHIREGWLRKGLKHVEKDEGFFRNDNVVDVLGVGTNMVKSIRFWLQATGLTEEKIEKGSKRVQTLSKGFGDIINKYDPYFEDMFTLWLIHYKIVTNKELSTMWYLFFNDFKVEEFTKDEMIETMKISMGGLVKNQSYSEKSLMDDCNCIIKTYYLDKKENKNPEESTICPLTELKLIQKIKTSSGKEVHLKNKPDISNLDKLVVLYIMLENLKKNNNTTSIDNVLNDDCNAGKILNLDRNMLNEYLDSLKNNGYIQINRTAGLDKIYIKCTAKEEILQEYYEQL
ncbi:DUF4007 family protein [Clostridium sp. FP1]|uniref:DUF4007 family protein n=1 Tax=Clostridium sp. FP1 TaxID=2724076 RepID=UPI0013E97560|nr:DUF4007 family protein [Clostridium sp. FP1]MBZ9634599.1 DUF4007 family protein [Clostridium sp. FP1]